MAQMNSYTDYKSGTTSEEQTKLLETGKVLFSGKKTENGDPVTLSIPVSELKASGNNSGNSGGGMSMSTATPEYSNKDEGSDFHARIIKVNVENNTYTRVSPDMKDIYGDDSRNTHKLYIKVNANAATDVINAVVEIEQVDNDNGYYGVQSFFYNVVDSEFDFTKDDDDSSNEGHILKAIYPGGTAGEIIDPNSYFDDYDPEAYGAKINLNVNKVDGQWSQFHIFGRCYRVYDSKIKVFS